MNKSLSIILILLLFLIINLPFVYKDGFWDGDSNRIYAGLVNGFLKKTQLHGPYLQGKNYQFGYFFLIFKLYPLLSLPLEQLQLFMNYLNFAFATVMILFFWLSTVELFDVKTANLVVLVFMTTQAFLDLALYAHPCVAALSMLTVSFYLYIKYLKNKTNARWIFYLASLFFIIVSFTFRASMIFALPILLGTQFVLQNSFEKKYLIRALSFAILSVAFFVILGKFALDTSITSMSSEFQRSHLFYPGKKVNNIPVLAVNLKQYFVSIFNPKNFHYKLFAIMTGFGPAYFIVTFWGLIYLLAKKRYRVLLFCVSWILIPLCFWWQYVGMSPRYYLLIYVGFSFLLAYFIVLRFKRSFGVVFFLIFINFVISAASYKPLNSLRPGKYVTPKGERTLRYVPMGDFVSERKAKKHHIARLKKQFKQITVIPADSVLVVGAGMPYIFASFMLWDNNYEWHRIKYENITIYRIITMNRTFDLLHGNSSWPKNSLNILTAKGYFQHHTIAIMPQYRTRGAPINILPQYKYVILDL